MLFCEFVEGTGCRETDKNYQIYKELEIIYMHTDCTKEHIYEMGKKLVDNSKTERELEIEAEIKAEIKGYKEEIESNKRWIEYYTEMAQSWKEEGDKFLGRHNKKMAQRYKEKNASLRNKIKWLKMA